MTNRVNQDQSLSNEVKSDQTILIDTNSKGKDRNWRGRKIMSLKLADIFKELGYRQSLIDRLSSCGEVLKFVQQDDGSLRLYQAYFCKNKLCPMCNWRRSMKYSYQTSRIVDEAIKQEPKARFLFLTLTVRNVKGEDLNVTLTSLTQSFDRLFRRVKVKKNLLGYLRSVEITYNEIEKTYHPHIHVLMMIRPSYFRSSDDYISQKEWGDMWSQSLKVNYFPIVDIRVVKQSYQGIEKAIVETAKYPVKPMNLDVTEKQVVDDLYQGLYRKRQLGFGGLFKTIKKELELDDIENGDLVHTTDDGKLSQGTLIVAIWNQDKLNYFIKD
ncbi:protein rep [Streptococcus thoraltensis]|uniref:protein rep n=1 Tax=Streptococcus thoraltensis TaxID=55085 RepID=UPI00037C70F0